MFKEYFQKLKNLWFRPSEFYERVYAAQDEKSALNFSVMTGILLAVEMGVVEALSGGSLGNVAMVTILLLAAMPLVVTLWIYLWSAYMRLCAYLLGEAIPVEPLRQVVAYSMAGLVALGVGYGLGKWLALVIFVFQVFGVEKFLKCSRWTAVVYVGLPFSTVAVLVALGTLMFKVFK
jgi:hypothetical protein